MLERKRKEKGSLAITGSNSTRSISSVQQAALLAAETSMPAVCWWYRRRRPPRHGWLAAARWRPSRAALREELIHHSILQGQLQHGEGPGATESAARAVALASICLLCRAPAPAPAPARKPPFPPQHPSAQAAPLQPTPQLACIEMAMPTMGLDGMPLRGRAGCRRKDSTRSAWPHELRQAGSGSSSARRHGARFAAHRQPTWLPAAGTRSQPHITGPARARAPPRQPLPPPLPQPANTTQPAALQHTLPHASAHLR